MYPITEYGQNPFTSCFFIEQQADTSNFTKSIRYLLGEATQHFVGLKGEEIDEWTFESDFMSPSFPDCYIVTPSPNSAQFYMPVCKGVDEATMRKKGANMFQWLSEALGTNFAYMVSSDGLIVTFYHKQHPSIPLIRMDVTKTDETFDVVVIFNACRLDYTLFTTSRD